MKKKILGILTESENSKKISIAALAETVDEFLENNNKKAKKSSKKSINSKGNDDNSTNEVA